MQYHLTLHPSASLQRLALVVVLAVAAASCTAGSPVASTTMPANRVDCFGIIDSGGEPLFSNRVLDVIALPTEPLDLGRRGESGTPYEGLRFAKFGLIIRADRALTLEIVDVQSGTAAMQWIPLENPDQTTTRLNVGPCPGDGNEWIVFSGGLWVSDEPTCVTLAVTTDGRTNEARLGVEALCV